MICPFIRSFFCALQLNVNGFWRSIEFINFDWAFPFYSILFTISSLLLFISRLNGSCNDGGIKRTLQFQLYIFRILTIAYAQFHIDNILYHLCFVYIYIECLYSSKIIRWKLRKLNQSVFVCCHMECEHFTSATVIQPRKTSPNGVREIT